MSYVFKITPKMKLQFVSEAMNHLNALEKMLIILEQNAQDSEAVNAAFRAVHGIKGNSDYLGYKDINALAHAMEDLLDDLRGNLQVLDSQLLSALLAGHDQLRGQVAKVQDDEYEEVDVSHVISLLDRIGVKKARPVATPLPPAAQRSKVDKRTVFFKAAQQHLGYVQEVCTALSQGEKVQNARENLLRTLTTFHLSANYTGFSDIAEAVLELKNKIEALSSVCQKTAAALLESIAAVGRKLDQDSGQNRPTEPVNILQEADYTDMLGHEIRVAPEKLENLVNMVSQLVISRNSLNHLVVDKRAGQAEGNWLKELKIVTAALDRSIGQLQGQAMDLRLMKISLLFERLPRLVRDLAIKSGKKVRLVLLGEDFEVDRKIVEHLFEPMLHLIRNAVDHGIEPPAIRTKQSKVDEGVITVKAYQEGSFAIIDVIDDGQGLDLEVIRQNVIDKKLAAPEVLEQMTKEEIANLIFLPGYTTTVKATLVSGRGVGLDVVKNNIGAIGGSIILTHESGGGIRFSIRVPLSMALEDVLLVESTGDLYAVPFVAVQENISMASDLIHVLNAREFMSYQDMMISLRHLSEVVGVSGPQKLRKTGGSELAVIILAFGGRYQGIAVDKVLRRESILMKPLDKHLTHIKELRGAALMGDGSIVFVIDSIGIF